MTQAPMDFLAGTACSLVPGVVSWGPGWYLIAANLRVEAGPFIAVEDAMSAAVWLDDQSEGVHPAPWAPRYSTTGLLIGSRIRLRGDRQELGILVDMAG